MLSKLENLINVFIRHRRTGTVIQYNKIIINYELKQHLLRLLLFSRYLLFSSCVIWLPITALFNVQDKVYLKFEREICIMWLKCALLFKQFLPQNELKQPMSKSTFVHAWNGCVQNQIWNEWGQKSRAEDWSHPTNRKGCFSQLNAILHDENPPKKPFQ